MTLEELETEIGRQLTSDEEHLFFVDREKLIRELLPQQAEYDSDW